MRHRVAALVTHMIRNAGGGRFGRLRFRITYFIYHFLPWLGFDYPRLIEWKFILKNMGQKFNGGIFLDVGCTASLFIHELSSLGTVYGLDSRPYHESFPKNIHFLLGDVSKMPFLDNHFDLISLVSVIEHIGLGAYGDPTYEQGDYRAMKELKRVLKPGGSLFVTTIVGDKYTISPNNDTRIYDLRSFTGLISEFIVEKEEYFIFRKRWVTAGKKLAFAESPHRFALACIQLTKPSVK